MKDKFPARVADIEEVKDTLLKAMALLDNCVRAMESEERDNLAYAAGAGREFLDTAPEEFKPGRPTRPGVGA